MFFHQVLQEIASHIGHNVQVRRVKNPLTNAIYYLESDQGQFALRINNDQATALGVDRVREKDILSLIQPHAFAPEVIDQRENWLLTRWHQGHHPKQIDEPLLQRIVALFIEIHSLPLPAGICERPLTAHSQVKHLLAQCVSKLSDTQIQAMQEALAATPESDQLTLCYHDWHSGNYLVGDNAHTLLDWEYAAAGDQLTDLACLVLGFNLTSEQTKFVLEQTNTNADAFQRMAALVKIMSALWYEVRFPKSEPSAALISAIEGLKEI